MLALFQIPLAANKTSAFPGKTSAVLTSSPYKTKLHEDRKRKQTRDQRKSSFKIRLQKKRQFDPSDSNVTVFRGKREMKKDSEDFEETSLVETEEENSDIDGECLCYSGLYRLLETDAAKSGSNAQNATNGAMKSVRVQTTGKVFFAFSATLNKCSARLP
jgi:hypothetical protein